LQEILRRLNAPAPSLGPEARNDAPEAPPAQPAEPSGSAESSTLDGAAAPSRAPWRSTSRDDYLERIEATLKLLQAQQREPRLARSGQALPPLAPFDAAAAPDGRLPELRPPLSLEPQRLAPPPQMNRRWPVPVAIAVSCAVTAAIGYFVTAGARLSPAPAPAPRLQASAPEQVVTAALPQRELVPQREIERQAKAQNDDGAAPSRPDAPPAVAQAHEPEPATKPVMTAVVAPTTSLQPATTATPEPAVSAAAESKASLPPATAAAAEPKASLPPATVAAAEPDAPASESKPSQPVRALGAAEIELLMQQAQRFIATGDLVTARILFQRAAKAGDAAAAVALGATYDPVVLAKLGVVGINPDVEKARTWYRTAESLGSSEATRRLAVIANR
jgi:hypothetical protein